MRRAAELTIALSVVLRDSRALRAERTRRADTDTRERAERAERAERVEERAGDEQGRRLSELGLQLEAANVGADTAAQLVQAAETRRHEAELRRDEAEMRCEVSEGCRKECSAG